MRQRRTVLARAFKSDKAPAHGCGIESRPSREHANRLRHRRRLEPKDYQTENAVFNALTNPPVIARST
jgi:hypothetical protein